MSNLTRILSNGTMVGNATLLNNHELCTLQTCDLSLAHFTYLPSIGGNALFAAIFGLLFVAQLGLGIRYRTWGYTIAMLCGLALEAVGYVGRILMHDAPFSKNDFLIYLICLTIAPAFLTAAIYLCLARIVTVYGAEISRIKPRTYTLIFCGCDLFSLVLQGLGGGIAATANTVSSTNTGKNIMIAGLAFQVASLLLFVGFCADFAWRLSRTQGSWNSQHLGLVYSRLFKAFFVGLCIAVITIFVRSVFRCIELSGGFKSALFASDQITFMVLEGAMISIATITLTVLHPAIGFQGTWHEADFSFWTKKDKGAEKSVVSVVTTDDESQRQGTKDANVMQMMGRV